ncbi:hypothetical protein KEJ25_07610 [Candidatus Bathyarchaeota archaeon]|nr:hypothetical protein [Candidatus Bathyarchaeota archaeon]
MSQAIEFKPGITWRVIFALFFASIVLLPVSIYLSLVSGAAIAGAFSYIVVILFLEVGSLMNLRLSKQELFIMFIMIGVAASTPMTDFIYRHYLVTGPVGWSFIDPFTNLPLPEVIPTFYVPYWKEIEFSRTLLSSTWLLPMFLSTLQFGVLFIIAEISLTIICAQLFLETEKLPFPFADISAQMINTLTDRPPDRMEVFIISAAIGAFYSFFLYGINTLSLGLWGTNIQVIPVPWWDLTTGLLGIERLLPGAALGIATDPLVWIGGFLIPFNTVVYMFASSILVWVIGNNLALSFFSGYFPLWKEEWTFGMSLSLVWQRSMLRVWLIPQIGFMLAISILALAQNWRVVVKGVRSLWRLSAQSKAAGYPSLKVLLALYFASITASVLIFNYFIPEFPVLPALAVSLGVSFLNAVIGTRAVGETGYAVSIPYAWAFTIMLSGYPKIDAWFFTPVIGGSSTPTWVQNIKVAYLTETKPIDFLKAFVIAFILYTIFGVIYASVFWMIAPIPSSAYPNTLISWPVQAINQLMWATRQVFTLNLPVLLFFFFLAIGLGIGGSILTKLTSIPFSIMGIATGISTLPAFTIPMFLAALIGRFLMPRFLGREWWEKYKTVVAAGIATGEGVLVGLVIGIVLLSKVGWILPF